MSVLNDITVESGDFIGVFDSGVGGLSILAKLTEVLPNEDFLFYGDSANAPYGEKTEEKVRELAMELAERLLAQGAKGLVIACNTATSAAARQIRQRYPKVPVVGVEPAIKPAVQELKGKRILVMATPMTLKREKYQTLAGQFEGQAQLIPLSCPGLAAAIEKGDPESSELSEMLEELLAPYKGSVDGVVLGCTHYPFVRERIREILGPIAFFDGADGTARQLKRLLTEMGLLTERTHPGKVVFDSSQKEEEELLLYEQFYERAKTL